MHLHFYCLDVSWMNKAKDIQQLKIIWICFNIFSSDNICERSTLSSVDYNIIWPKKGIFLSIFLIFVWQLRSSKKKEDFEKRIERYQNHRAFSPIFVTFKLLQNIVRSSADASPPEHSELQEKPTKMTWLPMNNHSTNQKPIKNHYYTTGTRETNADVLATNEQPLNQLKAT